MNERIKTLAEQAEVWNEDGDKCEVDIEKFTELIVRECIDQFCLKGAVSADGGIVKDVMKHFGVKP